jgi:hypothetical protein
MPAVNATMTPPGRRWILDEGLQASNGDEIMNQILGLRSIG